MDTTMKDKLPTTELEKVISKALSNPITDYHHVIKKLRVYIKENYPFIK